MVGVVNIAAQRAFIQRFFPEDLHLLMIDDDVTKIQAPRASSEPRSSSSGFLRIAKTAVSVDEIYHRMAGL